MGRKSKKGKSKISTKKKNIKAKKKIPKKALKKALKCIIESQYNSSSSSSSDTSQDSDSSSDDDHQSPSPSSPTFAQPRCPSAAAQWGWGILDKDRTGHGMELDKKLFSVAKATLDLALSIQLIYLFVHHTILIIKNQES